MNRITIATPLPTNPQWTGSMSAKETSVVGSHHLRGCNYSITQSLVTDTGIFSVKIYLHAKQ